jgi:hypothetical protein
MIDKSSIGLSPRDGMHRVNSVHLIELMYCGCVEEFSASLQSLVLCLLRTSVSTICIIQDNLHAMTWTDAKTHLVLGAHSDNSG